MKILIIICILFSVSCGVSTPKKEYKYKAITQALLNHTQTEERYGKLIYQKDSFAWYASDYITEKNLLKKEMNIEGWIVDLNSENPFVVFMSMENNTPISKLIVHPSESGSVHYLPETTNPRHISMFKARAKAIETTDRMCNGRYDTAVIEDGENWIVYLLVAPFKENTLFAGGNYKITINKNSFDVIENKPLSKTCFALPVQTEIESWPMMTHLVESTPNAVHSFLSLQNDLTYYVLTDTGPWKISNGEITFIEGE